MKRTSEDDEELDYMSDAILESLSTPPPGLVTVRSVTRKRASDESAKSYMERCRRDSEAKVREEGLRKQVDSSNKGFGLLLKMGYKPGEGLGKNSEGRLEPVPIDLPEGKSGLGLVSSRKERLQAILEFRKRKIQAERNMFRSAMSHKYQLCRVQNQLVSARNMCFQLDAEKGITIPVHPSYWPLREDEQDNESASDSCSSKPFSDPKRRRAIRGCHFSMSDNSDLPSEPDTEDDEEADLVSKVKLEENVEETLEKIVRYLRRKHSFCFWCSVQYESQDHLLADCPGPCEADHD
ncbi:unnamed protein product [Dicrocoelium dendriticum]|nr:unnamed protein product [Dicrocoelium dendriticum]